MRYLHPASTPSLFALLAVVLTRTVTVRSDESFNIGDTISSNFESQFPGTSTIVVGYTMSDGATFGNEADGLDFYVLQSLQDFENCDAPFLGLPPISLDAATEPTISGLTSTTAVVSTANWPPGQNRFCLRFKLMLRTTGETDFKWHQRDFRFGIDVTFAGGSATLLSGGDEQSEKEVEATAISDQAMETDSAMGIPPVFSASVTGSFGYGEDIPIVLRFNHPLDIFIYHVETENAIPVDQSNIQLVDYDGNPIGLRTSSFAWTNEGHDGTGVEGVLTVKFPLAIFQMTELDAVRVQIPVNWSNKEEVRRRRNLRPSDSMAEQSAVPYFTGTSTGAINEFVEVQLVPYYEGQEESGALPLGFSIGGIILFYGAVTLLAGEIALLI